MRLQEVYAICQNVQNSWCDLAFEEKKGTGNITYYKLSNADNVRGILRDLDPITSFSSNIEKVRKTSVGFTQPTVEVNLDQRAKSILQTEYQRLLNKVLTITELFESLNYSQTENGLDIKMPPQLSLSDFSKCTKDLNTIFSTCPLFSKTDNTITLSAVDVGSIWLSFVIGGAAIATVLGMVAALVDKALIIRSHYLTTKEQVEKVRSLKLGNDMVERMEKDFETIGKKLIETHSEELCKQYDIKDPEDFERMKNSLNLLTDWMNKGMEVYASIKTPDEVKCVFPPIETQLLSIDKIALLGKQNSQSQE